MFIALIPIATKKTRNLQTLKKALSGKPVSSNKFSNLFHLCHQYRSLRLWNMSKCVFFLIRERYHCSSIIYFSGEKRKSVAWEDKLISGITDHLFASRTEKIPFKVNAPLFSQVSSPTSKPLLSFPCFSKPFFSPFLLPNTTQNLPPFLAPPVSSSLVYTS